MDATFLFIDFIYVVADLDITEAGFSLMASNPFLRYTATLYISNDFCLNYSLMDEPHSASISLPSLRDAITVDGAAQFDTVAINLEDLDQLTLTFETLTPSGHEPYLRQNLRLYSPSEREDFGIPITTKYFIVKCDWFRHILSELPVFNDDVVCVTPMASQVIFSVVSKEIILTEEDEQCIIMGYEECVDTQFQIVLQPRMFFHNLSFETSAHVWFLRTINSGSAMLFPVVSSYVQYFIRFPPT
ncbi:uncharacterized protein LOC111792828 [Cucurbita pepo subsp. pepo]|uniref:uncharacterized protein LOC111792828 n=1 Tax=Cucurbita pepo subsp. pepo TaxID=3664 RepID=UPI000C9D3F94|nr:uncharacterized protein LOC111792828 [Cucurbita pepo subsp. pepo]